MTEPHEICGLTIAFAATKDSIMNGLRETASVQYALPIFNHVDEAN